MAENSKNENTTLVNFRVDAVVKESAESALAGMGISMSAYVGMCLRKLAQDRELPFNLKVNPDFWMKESEVSKVMETVENGSLEHAMALESAIEEEASMMYGRAIKDVVNRYEWGAKVTYIDNRSVSRLYSSTKEVIASGIWADDLEDSEGFDAWCEDVCAMIEEKCSDFCGEYGYDMDGEDAVHKVNSIIDQAVYAFDKYNDHLAARFFNSKADSRTYENIALWSRRAAGRQEEHEGMPEMRKEFLQKSALFDIHLKDGEK